MSKNIEKEIRGILKEDARRQGEMRGRFNPITGEGSLGERFEFAVAGMPMKRQWLPVTMRGNRLVRALMEAGSVDAFLAGEQGRMSSLRTDHNQEEEEKGGPTEEEREAVVREFVRVRMRHDFAFWAATFVYIKNKRPDGEPEVLFRLTYPQRKFVGALEEARLAGRPIRLVLLKARQWGGSTTSQLYMAWMQLTRKRGLNSLIIAHQSGASDEIKDMFDRMIKSYPLEMLHEAGDSYAENEAKMVGVGKSGSIFRIPQRDCKVKLGTAERPDSCRGGDYALVHMSEVGIWKETDGKKPQDIVRSACGGVVNQPNTMIVYESTANGHGNFFHTEYTDARDNPKSQFRALFVPWFEIDWNVLPFETEGEREAFARELWENRENAFAGTNREEPGQYLWRLWKLGATLEGIRWYMAERTKHTSHGSMAAECPSDDIEAFVNSGSAVFDKYLVEEFASGCRLPLAVGDIYGREDCGKGALEGLCFREDRQGVLKVWAHPDNPGGVDASPAHRLTASAQCCGYMEEYVARRYLTVVDIGGRGNKADWSVICVFDRVAMMDGGKPAVVAQWRGHTDVDLLAWKAAQIAAYYENSLLVIESNTLETHDRTRVVDGDQSQFILNQIKTVYPNLYARKQSEEDIRLALPRKYGFHTNTATKPMIISGLIKAVRERAWVEADRGVLDELLSYERKPNGAYGAISGFHDDLLMTRAIGLHICFNEMELPVLVEARREARAMHVKGRSEAVF